MVSLGQDIVDILLLGSTAGRRHLQDSPVLPDVWAAFAANPGKPRDLLITPFETEPAGRVAVMLAKSVRKGGEARERDPWRIAFLQGIVAATLSFEELIRHVMPITTWWRNVLKERKQPTLGSFPERHEQLRKLVAAHLRAARVESNDREAELGLPLTDTDGHQPAEDGPAAAMDKDDLRIIRYLCLIGAIRAARDSDMAMIDRLDQFLDHLGAERIADEAIKALRIIEAEVAKHLKKNSAPIIWSVSLNRRATTAAEKSVPAIKADAARSLFNISCANIGWAVLDTGIDGTHQAFLDHSPNAQAGQSRVVATYDFTKIRNALSVDHLMDPQTRRKQAQVLAPETCQLAPTIDNILKRFAKDAEAGRSINWADVEALVERKTAGVPRNPHGTHVAGILGADLREDQRAHVSTRTFVGVCPDIRLYDFRVIGDSAAETEFAVIAALQFIRHLNRRNNFVVIHGANMSLSIPHNVRNYACGRTPVCNEAEELVASGVVVVAAAGNRGFQRYRLADGASFENYAASSITDPGNADGVITVGATHRYWPHTYGVSFFSSRGPTGDGRLKPDLVAPGEKIESTVPGNRMDVMDGTSMAAPHVSGAAALLIARHTELKGQPTRVKAILCKTATDLGREPSFQGAGMLDTLRALQSV